MNEIELRKIGLKPYQKLLPILTIPICLILIIFYGWSFYSTITKRPGLHGDMHFYYNLTIIQYSIYNLIVAIIAFGLIILQLWFMIQIKSKNLTRTFLAFGIFIIIVIIFEFYLQTRFIEKG